MGNMFYTSIEAQIWKTLQVVIRIFVIVFMALVGVLAFTFAVTMTGMCVATLGLCLMLRLVARRQETRRLFALAGC
jgi:hypothetical protein